MTFGVCARLLFSHTAKENTDMTVTETPATFSSVIMSYSVSWQHVDK